MAVVLIVEDEMFIRMAAEWTIGDLGYEVLLACDQAEALDYLNTSKTIDVLFVDIRLDKIEFGGYNVADQALALWPELRVLYTSGSTLDAKCRIGSCAAASSSRSPTRPRNSKLLWPPCLTDTVLLSRVSNAPDRLPFE